jgi:hypothetical protein
VDVEFVFQYPILHRDVIAGTSMLPYIGAGGTAVVAGAVKVGQLIVPLVAAVQAVMLGPCCCAAATQADRCDGDAAP